MGKKYCKKVGTAKSSEYIFPKISLSLLNYMKFNLVGNSFNGREQKV